MIERNDRVEEVQTHVWTSHLWTDGAPEAVRLHLFCKMAAVEEQGWCCARGRTPPVCHQQYQDCPRQCTHLEQVLKFCVLYTDAQPTQCALPGGGSSTCIVIILIVLLLFWYSYIYIDPTAASFHSILLEAMFRRSCWTKHILWCMYLQCTKHSMTSIQVWHYLRIGQ